MPKTGLTSEQIKERAIECTMSRMRKFGFEKVRLSEIARDLGVTHAALYSHFADKAALFDAVSERWLVEIDERLEAISSDKKTADPLARLTNWFIALHRAKCAKVRTDPELYKAFNYSAQVEKPFVRAHLQNMNRQLHAMIKQALDRKQLRGETAAIASLLFEATISFHHPLLVAQHMDEEREEMLKHVLKALLDGLK